MTPAKTYPRSPDGRYHPSRDWMKAYHARRARDIPPGWRISGEYAYAQHSIVYARDLGNALPSYFLGFGVWDESNSLLGWNQTTEVFDMLDIAPVPVLHDGLFDEKMLARIAASLDPTTQEGFVVRIADLVKADILQRILDDGYEPVLVIDDRPQVVRMWRDHGITTLQCAADEQGASADAGQTMLHMLVGPCCSGKSTYAAATYKPHEIVSTDELRLQLFGNLGHSPEALARVWKLAHGLIRARLDAGVFTVLDATNLRSEDRARVLDLLPRGVFARYVVIDRDLDRKIKERGWRSEELVLKHHRLFRAEEKAIMAGDGHPYVTVQDKRSR